MQNKINLTAHTVNIFNSKGEEVEVVPPSGWVARIKTERELNDTVDGVEFYYTVVTGEAYMVNTETKEVEPLHAPKPDTIYIVSGLFRSHFDRYDFWQPGELLTDSDGVVYGCVGLSR